MRTPLLMLGIGELLILYTSLYVAGWIVYGSIERSEEQLGSLFVRASITAVVMLISLISMGLYQLHQRVSYREVLVRLGAGFALGSLALVVVFSALPGMYMSLELIQVAAIYVTVLLLISRYVFVRRVDENVFRHHTIVFGAGKRAGAIRDLRRKADRRGFKVVGTVPAPGDSQMLEVSGKLIEDEPIDQLAERLGADEIVIAMDDRRGNLPIRELLNAKLKGTDVIDLLEFLERETGKIRIDLVNPGWLIFSPGFRTGSFKRFCKRLLDLFASIGLLLLTWPLMLVIAAAIKIEDGIRAPIFYRQKRVGYRGDPFDVLKFRSMHENAEVDGRAVWASENDKRATRVGGVLRKLRLDELPQFFNVIRGQMSIVGPRPERPEFVEKLSESIPYYAERHAVNPGITGWAQLRYSYGASEEDAVEKLQYDLYYVKNHSLLLDVMIILQTAEVILWGKGAR